MDLVVPLVREPLHCAQGRGRRLGNQGPRLRLPLLGRRQLQLPGFWRDELEPATLVVRALDLPIGQ
eukprot:2164147-Alexandrium_andersonii.AAC.1